MEGKEESKDEKFKRLAASRVNSALKQISLIGNLASPQYFCTPEQVEKILSALEAEIDEVRTKFRKRSERSQNKFEL